MKENSEKKIIEAYESYKANEAKYVTYGNIAHMHRLFKRYCYIIHALERNNIKNINEKRILGVGCGNGSLLRFFSECRGSYKGLYGVDLRPDIINQGKKIYPLLDISSNNAEDIIYKKHYFDIVCLQTVFSLKND